MRLVHYSDKYLTRVRSVPQHRCRDGLHGDLAIKPLGLWVSVEGENDWPTWCEAIGYHPEKLTHQTEIVLRTGANILHLSTPNAVSDFYAQYRCSATNEHDDGIRAAMDAVRDIYVGHGYPANLFFDALRVTPVRWSAVAERHSGIIMPYFHWECTSCCLWNANAVAELRPMRDR